MTVKIKLHTILTNFIYTNMIQIILWSNDRFYMIDLLQYYKLQQWVIDNKLTIIAGNLNNISNKINTDINAT